jgi:ABC-type transporter MlaC component
MPERPMWDKEVALELGPGPFGVQLDRGPNKRGVVIAGFEPVDGAMGPAEAHGGVEKGMLLVKVDTKDVSTMRRSKIAKLLKETQNRKRTLIFGRLTVGSPEAVVKLPSIASAPNDGAGAKPKASESLKNGKNDKSSKAPDPGNKRELNAASLMKGVAMDVVAHNLADDLAKTLSKKERKALKKAKKAKKNKKSKKMKKSTGKSLEALDVSILDDLDAMVDEEAKEESEAATVPSSRNQRDRGPIDPMTDKRAKKNGFHGNEGGGRRGPERMQSSVSIVEEVAEEEGDDEGADERLPRELEEVEEDIPDEIDETQAAALAHTALSRTDTGADYEDFEDEFEDSDEPDATAAGGGQDDWASMAMGGNARESVSELMEAAADRAIASAQPQRVDAYGNEASTETVHPLYTADVVDDEDENEDDFEGGGAEAGMEQTVFDSLPFCATSPDTLGLVLGLVRSGGVDIAARDGEGNTILQGRRGILARSPSLLFVLGTRSFNMSCR